MDDDMMTWLKAEVKDIGKDKSHHFYLYATSWVLQGLCRL